VFGKILYKYFRRWRETTDEKLEGVNHDLKLLMISRYFGLLREAFTRWISYKGVVMHES
jgi:hypothetical protein